MIVAEPNEFAWPALNPPSAIFNAPEKVLLPLLQKAYQTQGTSSVPNGPMPPSSADAQDTKPVVEDLD